ncbi:MAG: TIR domain-containing protein [Candidatus Thiodiazotropha sp.]
MNKPAAFITLKRKKTSSYQIRQFAITIDDSVVGKIKSGETKQFKVPCGCHDIGIKIDLYKSEPLRIDLKPDQTLDLECGDRSPETYKEAFTLKGIEKSLNSLIKPKQYLYVQPVGNSAHQLRSRSVNPAPEPSRMPRDPGRSRTIFISYRRGDSREITGRICDRLNNEFGKEAVFRDVDSIPGGVDFREHINQAIERCGMLVAIIGDKWLEAKNSRGERRLDLANDHLRVELETALKKEIPVIPVLVKKGVMPEEDQLPGSLKPLAYRNAIPIPEEPFFHNGVDLLIQEMNKSFSPNEPGSAQKRMSFCIHCGNELMPGHKFCIQCGKPV